MTLLRVVQLNIESLFEPDWHQRAVEVEHWFRELRPDVVCLQGVFEDALHPNIAEMLAGDFTPDWHWCFGGFAHPGVEWPQPKLRYGPAILSRWPIDHHEALALPVDANPKDPHPSWRMPASLLHARIAGLDIFSTQLATPPAQATLRVRQVLAIDAAIRARREPATPMPAVLCGDLNARPHADEIRFLTGNAVISGRSTYYQDAWDVVWPSKPGFTVGARTNARDEVLTVASQRIDYVMVGEPFRRPGGAGRILGAALAFHEERTGIKASSHHGLAVDIRWPQRP